MTEGRLGRLAGSLIIRVSRAPLVRRAIRLLLGFLPMAVQRRLRARRSALAIAAGERLVPEKELERKYAEALRFLADRHGRDALGDYLEFGVFHGASLTCMHRALNAAGFDHVRLFGFDSFAGLPAAANMEDDGAFREGQFTADERLVRRLLTERGLEWHRTVLVKGWFSDTLTEELAAQHRIAKASIIMVDCDIYSSTRDALRFCAPLIRDETIIFFDDWMASNLDAKNMGEKRAFEEFLRDNPHLTAEEFGRYVHHELPAPAPEGLIFRVQRRTA
jgi:predicted O-methyltransferase YrrM